MRRAGRPADGPDRTRWVAINACLVPAAAFDQQEVVTAEGLGRPGQLHPVQREMAERGGSQCGYCTPGFICSMAAEYYRPDRRAAGAVLNGSSGPGVNGSGAADRSGAADQSGAADGLGAADHEHGPNGFDLHALSGNLCRCTGYRPIRDAAYALGAPESGDPFLTRLAEPAPGPAATTTSSTQGRYVRPPDLAGVLELLAVHPDARLVAGSTDWGVELNIRHARAALTIGIDRLEELREFSLGPDRIDLGAALSLSEIEARLAGRVPLLADLFPQFASRLIRNGATLGGNLGTASPIGDAPPALLALDASLVLASAEGEREVLLADYFTGYRQSVKRPDELIKTIRLPLPLAPVTAFHKIAKRRFDDISSVAVAYALTLDGDGDGGGRREPGGLGPDRPGRGGGHAAARDGGRGGAEGPAVDPRDGRRGRRRAGPGRHADERSPGQRELPDRHAAQLAAEVLRRAPRAGRRPRIMSRPRGTATPGLRSEVRATKAAQRRQEARRRLEAPRRRK